MRKMFGGKKILVGLIFGSFDSPKINPTEVFGT